MKRVALISFVAATALVIAAFWLNKPIPQDRVLLAVFAHPDDEAFIGPVLARYAREGVKVYLAFATKGEKGTAEHAGIAAGDALAAERRKEAMCASEALGIEWPIFFELSDGELGAITNPLAQNVHAVADKVQELIMILKPQVVLTWGPEGGYGHSDHRLVSNAVTQVVQGHASSIKLYYAGMTLSQAKALNAIWPPELPWHTVDPSFLNVNIAFSERDRDAHHQAFICHKSQYTPEYFKTMLTAMDQGWTTHASFRAWSGPTKATDLF
jgi:LmbE family N-acetylglucosaminyl deacetylase